MLIGGPQHLEASKDEDWLSSILKRVTTKIVVVGVGGAGNNTVTRLMNDNVKNVATVAVNTDAQDLFYCKAHKKLLIGKKLTGGLGAGNDPEIGEAAAIESEEEIKEILRGADLVFVTCGLGGGTGTGAAPIVAEISKKLGALTVSICTLPFRAEGKKRIKNALGGLQKIVNVSDTFIPVPNDKLLEVAGNASIFEAFRLADGILINGVKGITEMLTTPGLVNIDFADLKTVLSRRGYALIGIGEGEGEQRALKAIRNAINSPLIDIDIKNAKSALINVTGNRNLKLKEAEMAVDAISRSMNSDAEIIWGAIISQHIKQTALRVTLVVAGIELYDYEAKFE